MRRPPRKVLLKLSYDNAIVFDLPDRYWSKVRRNKKTGCWEWTAANANGYGRFAYPTRTKVVGATRLILESLGFHVGEAMALHSCDNPPCVNPEHLFLGDHSANAVDCVNKGRNGDSSQPGERNGRAKLTWCKVGIIRRFYSRLKRAKSGCLARGEFKRLRRRFSDVPNRSLERVVYRNTWVTR